MALFLNMKVFISCILIIMLVISITEGKKKKKNIKSEGEEPCTSRNDCAAEYCSFKVTYCVEPESKPPSTNVCVCCISISCGNVLLININDKECTKSKKGEQCHEQCVALGDTPGGALVDNYVCGKNDKPKRCYCGTAYNEIQQIN